MNKTYQKPVIELAPEAAEGVYLASGANGCYTTTANIHQSPQNGRGDYRISVTAAHASDHTKDNQLFTITFNQPVSYRSCNGQGALLQSGNESTTLTISLTYRQNPNDNIQFGDLVVESDPGLSIVSCSMTD